MLEDLQVPRAIQTLHFVQNSILLHVNRMMMSTFSPFFQSLFNSDFIEKNEKVVDIDMECNVLLEILKILHHFGSTGHTLYPPLFLKELYIQADKYDIPLIRELVKQQLSETAPKEAYEVALEVELEKERSASLSKMTSSDVKTFLNGCESDIHLTVYDVITMLQKLNVSGIYNFMVPFPKSNNQENCSIPKDFDSSWGTSDAEISVYDISLFVNKAVLATFSPFFHALFFGDTADKMQHIVELDEDYEIILEILRILHHVDRNFGLINHKIFEAEKLCDMYKTAAKLELEVIKEFCKQQLVEANPPEALKVAIELDLSEQRLKIFEKMSMEDITTFLEKSQQREEQLFSPKEMAQLVEKVKGSVKPIPCTICTTEGSKEVVKEPAPSRPQPPRAAAQVRHVRQYVVRPN